MNERDRRIAKQKRRAQVRRKMTLLFTSFIVILALCFGIGFYNARKVAKANANSQIQQEQRLEDAKQKLDKMYLAFSDTNTQQETPFSDWVLEHYFPKNPEALCKINKDNLYELTGESMHVLSDRYQGRITKENYIFERTGKTNGEAEITIAGDLCFAEDGFVLDYYDTVKDLKKCISPYLLNLMNDTDLFYLNHEYCISDRGTALSGKYFTFRAKPERMEL